MNKRTEQRTQMIIAGLALTGLLAYTFVHTGGLMSRYIHPAFVGYMAAFGVELTVAGISFRLASLKRKQLTSRSLLFILISALFVSALANISEGYTVRYGKSLTWVNLGDIDYIQAVIGIAATGLISLMVFAISELIGVDVEAVVKQTEREQKPARATGESEPVLPELARAPQERPLELAPVAYPCDGCARTFETKQALSAHKRFCARMRNVDAGRPALDELALPVNGNTPTGAGGSVAR